MERAAGESPGMGRREPEEKKRKEEKKQET
jgi:hypothetical protein